MATFGSHTKLDFGNPDFVKLAEAFGWRGHRCEKSSDLQGVLERSFQEPGPDLVVIPIDYSENQKLTERLGNIEIAI